MFIAITLSSLALKRQITEENHITNIGLTISAVLAQSSRDHIPFADTKFLIDHLAP